MRILSNVIPLLGIHSASDSERAAAVARSSATAEAENARSSRELADLHPKIPGVGLDLTSVAMSEHRGMASGVSDRRPGAALAVVSMAQFLIALDYSIMYVALLKRRISKTQ